MNIMHQRTYKELIRLMQAEMSLANENVFILDIGCGGGEAVRLFCTYIHQCKVFGVDHSSEMVELSKRINRKYIINGKAEIVKGDVLNLPFETSKFDLVSAFDTINLWDDIETSTKEVNRVLKTGGTFVIINAYPSEGSRWWNIVRFKSDREYISFLERHGFVDIQADLARNTIVIKGKKI